MQCLVSICEGLAQFTAPLYTNILAQRPRAAGDPPVRAPPALDLAALPPNDASTHHLKIVKSIIESCWPALLAALSCVISTNLSDELFIEVLSSYQALITVAGILCLGTPRDALFTSLAGLAVPTRVVSSLDTYQETPTPRAGTLSESLGLSSASTGPPGLSERNMACLKVLIGVANYLAGSLGESWYRVLEVLQNADYVLTAKGLGGPTGNNSNSNSLSTPSAAATKRTSSLFGGGAITPSRSTSSMISSSQSQQGQLSSQISRHPMFADLDSESMTNAMQRLFDASRNLEDHAYTDFITALCRLSAEMVGMQTQDSTLTGTGSAAGGGGSTGKTAEAEAGSGEEKEIPKRTEVMHRRRASGIHIPRTLVSEIFSLIRC